VKKNLNKDKIKPIIYRKGLPMGLFEMGKEKKGGSHRRKFKGEINRRELENFEEVEKGEEEKEIKVCPINEIWQQR